ncbi:leu operon leader peptide [Shigella flexneri]
MMTMLPTTRINSLLLLNASSVRGRLVCDISLRHHSQQKPAPARFFYARSKAPKDPQGPKP